MSGNGNWTGSAEGHLVIWTGERARQQRLLVTGMYQAAAGVPRERRAAIAGGLPGADKAAELDRAGLDRSRYLTVSIDAVLNRMAAAGLIPAPGRHEPGRHEPGGHEPGGHEPGGQEANGSSPLARAGLVHAEAQYLAK